MREHKNRYGDIFTFIENDDHDILWQGNFEYCRIGTSNDNTIEMIDPSGGPYIAREMRLDSIGFDKYVVKDFEKIDGGYKIITEKCEHCGQPANRHKMSCSTQKIQINL